MTRSLLRIAAGTAVVAATFAFHGVASAHSNTVVCIDQTTSTWRITNDYPLSESFTSPQGPSGTVAAGNGSYTDVVYVGDSLQIDAVWSDGFTESRTGTGDCTPEGGTTTTEATTSTTELVTTTTEQETTTSTSTTSTTESPTTTSTSVTTTTPDTSTSTTSTIPDSSTSTTTLELTTSSSVATTSTTSSPGSTSPEPSVASTTPPAPSSTTPECSDNPNTPTDDCAPICQPVTLEDGTNSCGPSLPATGTDILWLLPAATFMLLCGAVIVICGRRR